jgi:hypothetical protein
MKIDASEAHPLHQKEHRALAGNAHRASMSYTLSERNGSYATPFVATL